jgi:hypothetical protein
MKSKPYRVLPSKHSSRCFATDLNPGKHSEVFRGYFTEERPSAYKMQQFDS